MQTFTGVKRLSQALAFGLTFFLFQVHAQNMNITLRSNLTYSYALSNIGGFVDSLNNEYALVGHYEGLDVVNVTNPDSVYIQFTVPGPSSQWREVKTWEGFAYITTEGGGGLTVADLRELPDTVIYHNWTGNNAINGQLDNIHALHIEDGIAYLYGSNLFNGGAVMADLTDPWNPDYVGKYDNFGYIHDG
jgi:choice-of-anchor B domain-containing protein